METNDNKLKECHELVEKINETFKIRIDTHKKDASIVWFRHYIIDKFKDEAMRVSYLPLNKHHATISHVRMFLPKLKKRQEFIDIVKIVDSFDVEKYKEFLARHVKKRYEKRNPELMHESNVKKLHLPVNQAMILLRKNPKSLLWNKRISDWSYQDWQELKTY